MGEDNHLERLKEQIRATLTLQHEAMDRFSDELRDKLQALRAEDQRQIEEMKPIVSEYQELRKKLRDNGRKSAITRNKTQRDERMRRDADRMRSDGEQEKNIKVSLGKRYCLKPDTVGRIIGPPPD